MHIERFAPSPTGKLHLGHALSSLMVFRSAKRHNGKFLLRIEDLDFQRCKIGFEKAIFNDLNWLGITWSEEPLRQSKRLDIYKDTTNKLWEMGLLYKCECSRQDIANALRMQNKEKMLKGGPYPGICKDKRIVHNDFSMRLNMNKAMELIDIKDLFFYNQSDIGSPYERINILPEKLIDEFGDIIISRKDIKASYHIAVVVDDFTQEITQVTRGSDLFQFTSIHVLLQNLLQFNTPKYLHHRIIHDDDGGKLSKRNNSISLEDLRNRGLKKEDIFKLLDLKK